VKKFTGLLVVGVSALVLSGCGGGSSSYNDGLTTLFLVDEYDNSYGGIPYICDSMSTWSETAPNGEFSFYPGENCEFDFTGYNGLYGDEFDDIIRIVDYTYDGKGDIPYECELFGVGTTYSDGSFDYDYDDACVFYL